jgi:hypothetical protein
VDYAFERKLTLSGQAQPGALWFRIATGEIRRLPTGEFEVDGRWRVRWRGGAEPVAIGRELRGPLGVPGEVVEEITW